jgi:hypothetical protein
MSQIPIEEICELVSNLVPNFKASIDTKDIDDILSRIESFHSYQRRKIDESFGRITELNRKFELASLEIQTPKDSRQKELEELENEKYALAKSTLEQEELLDELEDRVVKINQKLDLLYERNCTRIPSSVELKLAIYEQLGIRILDTISDDSCTLAIQNGCYEESLDQMNYIDVDLPLEGFEFETVQRIWQFCSV